jgi:hypothetical protein
MIDMLWFQPSHTEDVGSVYYVPASETKVLTLLKEHGVQMTATAAPVSGVEQFTIASNTTRPAAQNGNSIDTGAHALRTLDGSWGPAAGVSVPKGAFAVKMTQPLARLAFYLLAPTSDDGVVAWNFLDDQLGDGAKTYPILRKK